MRDLPPPQFWWQVWFAVCAVGGIAALGVGAWAIVKLVNHFTG